MSLRPKALLIITLTVLVGIAGTWSDHSIAAGLWELPLGLLLLGLAYEGWFAARTRLCLAIESRDVAALGQAVPLELRLRHDRGRELMVEIAPDTPEGVDTNEDVQVVRVAPEHGTALRREVVPRRLGSHAWPAQRGRLAGPLGLAWWWRRLDVEFELRVTPRLLGAQATPARGAHSGLRERPRVGAGSELLQLREYQPGDPQSLIDWKASARTGRLISREHTADQHLDILIAIDAGRASSLRAGELDRLGHYANLAAQFAEYAVGCDDRVGLMIFADRPLAALPPARGASAVLRIRQLLGAARSVPAEADPLRAALLVRSLARQRCLVVMLTDLEDATLAGQLAQAARLLLPKHLPLLAGLKSPEAEAMTEAEAHTWLDPYEALAAREYLARLQRNVQALRALGAPALVARPDRLRRAVFEAYVDFRRRRRV